MSTVVRDHKLTEAPRFEADPSGKVTHVSVAVDDYLRLLVACSIVDPEQWPEQYRHGAKLLARIREIERKCMDSNDGDFDFDVLSPDTQDEYDGAISDLNRILFPGPGIPHEEVMKELGLTHLLNPVGK